MFILWKAGAKNGQRFSGNIKENSYAHTGRSVRNVMILGVRTVWMTPGSRVWIGRKERGRMIFPRSILQTAEMKAAGWCLALAENEAELDIHSM